MEMHIRSTLVKMKMWLDPPPLIPYYSSLHSASGVDCIYIFM